MLGYQGPKVLPVQPGKEKQQCTEVIRGL